MNQFNRRAFLQSTVASATVLAIAPVGSLRAQTTEDDRIYESVLTGSHVELVSSNWEFLADFELFEETEEFTREVVAASTESVTLEVEFVQTSVDAEAYLDIVQRRYRDAWDVVEIFDSGVTADGAWFAASILMEPGEVYTNAITMSVYCEYQVGAYENADLLISVNSRVDRFEASIESVQAGVRVGDLEPLLMVDSSDVLALAFPVLATTTQSQSGNESTTSGERRSGRSQAGQSASSDDGEYVDAVWDHRTEFISSFNEFAEALSQFVDESSTDASMQQAYATLDRVAGDWTSYPATAQQMTAPERYSVLESLYLTWADEIGVLGQAWIDAVNGVATGDDVFNQIDVVDRADKALVAELDSL